MTTPGGRSICGLSKASATGLVISPTRRPLSNDGCPFSLFVVTFLRSLPLPLVLGVRPLDGGPLARKDVSQVAPCPLPFPPCSCLLIPTVVPVVPCMVSRLGAFPCQPHMVSILAHMSAAATCASSLHLTGPSLLYRTVVSSGIVLGVEAGSFSDPMTTEAAFTLLPLLFCLLTPLDGFADRGKQSLETLTLLMAFKH